MSSAFNIMILASDQVLYGSAWSLASGCSMVFRFFRFFDDFGLSREDLFSKPPYSGDYKKKQQKL
jgi:hypothetical protein